MDENPVYEGIGPEESSNGNGPAEQPAEEPGVTPPEGTLEVQTAFLVYINRNGSAVASSNIEQPLMLDRECTLEDMYRASVEVAKDVQVSQTSNVTAQIILMALKQQAEAAMASRLTPKEQMAATLARKGIQVPRPR